MSEVPTVKIQADNELGYVVLNQSDFDSETMQKYCETGNCPLPETADFVSSELPIGEEERTLREPREDIFVYGDEDAPETRPADNSDQRTLVEEDSTPQVKKPGRPKKSEL